MSAAAQPSATMTWMLRVFLFFGIVGIGTIGFVGLARLRRPAPRREQEETAQPVTVMTAQARPERIMLSGYGTVRAKTTAVVSPEIAGRVVAVADHLDDGNPVAAGAVLCRLDDRDIVLGKKISEAEKARLQAEISVLQREAKNAERLLTLRRQAMKLDEAELKRVTRLLEDADIGTQSGVDRAQQAAIRSREQAVALENQLARIPLQIKSLKTQIQRVELQLAQGAVQLERSTVKAPFAGRLAAVNVELGQIVTPGQPLLRIVADEHREITVSLDTRLVARWLAPMPKPRTRPGWFEPVKPTPVEVRWTEDKSHVWPGTLARIAAVDERTRTVQMVVALEPAPALPFDLTPGMFCEVRIPGHREANVIRFPRAAINADGEVFVAVDGRLASRSFELLVYDGDDVLVRGPVNGGKEVLRPGDRIVLTKLDSVVDGMKLQVRRDDTDGRP